MKMQTKRHKQVHCALFTTTRNCLLCSKIDNLRAPMEFMKQGRDHRVGYRFLYPTL